MQPVCQQEIVAERPGRPAFQRKLRTAVTAEAGSCKASDVRGDIQNYTASLLAEQREYSRRELGWEVDMHFVRSQLDFQLRGQADRRQRHSSRTVRVGRLRSALRRLLAERSLNAVSSNQVG